MDPGSDCFHQSSGHWLALRWRHNGRDSVSNHQPHDYLLNRLFKRRSKKTSKLRVTGLCAGNSQGTDEFKWPVTQKMLPFDDVIMGVDDDWNLPCCFTRPKRVSVTYYSIWLIKLIRRCFEQPQGHQFSMMTSSNGNIFRVAGPLCEEFTGQRWNPRAHKGQWRGAVMFSLTCARINGWVNNREAGDLRRNCAHYDITVMLCRLCVTTISDTGCLPNTGLCVSCFC